MLVTKWLVNRDPPEYGIDSVSFMVGLNGEDGNILPIKPTLRAMKKKLDASGGHHNLKSKSYQFLHSCYILQDGLTPFNPCSIVL